MLFLEVGMIHVQTARERGEYSRKKRFSSVTSAQRVILDLTGFDDAVVGLSAGAGFVEKVEAVKSRLDSWITSG